MGRRARREEAPAVSDLLAVLFLLFLLLAMVMGLLALGVLLALIVELAS